MKRILVLGAGTYQVPLIRHARESGHWIAAASWNPDDPGMQLAHQAWVVNTTDKERLLELVQEQGIDAVMTTGTDVALPSIGHLCDRLGLPGLTYQTALNCTNKILMQRRLTAANVPSAVFRNVKSLSEAQRAAQELTFPVILKAPDSSGSRGVRVVQKSGELQPAFEAASKVSRNGEVLVEELLVGEEFGAQLIVIDGKLVYCLCHNDTLTPPPISVPVGHSCPSRLSKAVQQEAALVCASAVGALGIRNAVCNADLINTAEGVFVLEIGARIGATGLPEIVQLHFGVNLYDVALQFALGRRPSVAIHPGPAAAVSIIRAAATGKLTRCRIPPSVDNEQGVVFVHFDYTEGSSVRRFRVGPDRIGHAVVVGETAESAEAFASMIVKKLDISVRRSEYTTDG